MSIHLTKPPVCDLAKKGEEFMSVTLDVALVEVTRVIVCACKVRRGRAQH